MKSMEKERRWRENTKTIFFSRILEVISEVIEASESVYFC
jgi:hypothetical protein